MLKVGSFCIIGMRATLKLGSFCIFGVVGVSPTSVGVKYRGGRPAARVVFIGFVSHFSRVDRVVVGVDWVRFAHLGVWPGCKLGSFRIFGPPQVRRSGNWVRFA